MSTTKAREVMKLLAVLREYDYSTFLNPETLERYDMMGRRKEMEELLTRARIEQAEFLYKRDVRVITK